MAWRPSLSLWIHPLVFQDAWLMARGGPVCSPWMRRRANVFASRFRQRVGRWPRGCICATQQPPSGVTAPGVSPSHVFRLGPLQAGQSVHALGYTANGSAVLELGAPPSVAFKRSSIPLCVRAVCPYASLQGKLTVKRLPFPSPSLSAFTCPPCNSTRRFTSDSPNPVPS